MAKDAEGVLDMSLGVMAGDLVALLKVMFPIRAKAPSVVLVGHSMVRKTHLGLAWGCVS